MGIAEISGASLIEDCYQGLMACFKLIIIKVLHVQIQIKKVENFEAYVAHYADCSFYCYLLLQWIIHNIYIYISWSLLIQVPHKRLGKLLNAIRESPFVGYHRNVDCQKHWVYLISSLKSPSDNHCLVYIFFFKIEPFLLANLPGRFDQHLLRICGEIN